MNFRMWLAGSVVVLLSVSACTPPPDLPDADNVEPVARLVWPQRWTTEEAAPFDASLSADPDGLVERMSLSFGDGTPEQDRADGVFEHLYAAPGAYDVRLEVEDDDGAMAEVIGTVVVVERIDDPPCSCDTPCFGDAVCTAEGCFLSGVSLDEDVDGGQPPVIADPISCP